jgi:hypothetical protein
MRPLIIRTFRLLVCFLFVLPCIIIQLAWCEGERYAKILENFEKNGVRQLQGIAEKLGKSEPIALACLKTAGNDGYVGLIQKQLILAPFEAVVRVVEDVSSYDRLFPGYKKISLDKKEGNRWETTWEQIIPVPFIPNIRFRMIYFVSEPEPGIKMYRYTLMEPGQIKANDGLIVLEKKLENGKEVTLYTELDFIDANWGILKTFGYQRIWANCIRGIAQADIAIRLKAENPAWKDATVQKKADEQLRDSLIDDCYGKRRSPMDLGITRLH